MGVPGFEPGVPGGVDSIFSSNVDNVSGLLDWISTGPVWDWICVKVYLPSHVHKPG